MGKGQTSATSTRRIGAEDSKTRARLLDAAQQLMLEAGYAAVTSRRVAAKAGLKPQLVHYYFRTMDDLFLALFRRGAEENLEKQAHALQSARPLHALWSFSTDRVGTALTLEFIALANHRDAIRNEIAAYAERFRRLQAEALSDALKTMQIDGEELPAVALLVLMTSISRVLVMEDALGVTTGHAEALSVVQRLLDRHEGTASSD